MLIFRDHTTIIPALRDPGLASIAAPGVLSAVVLPSGTYFTETMHVGKYVELIAFLQTTAHAGTNPTLDVKFQLSPDQKQWIDAGDAFTQVTTTDGITMKKLTANFGRYMRAVLTVGGTASPNYTMTLSVIAKA